MDQEIKQKHGFIGWWMPVEIIQMENISWVEKCLWCCIHSYSKGEKGCFASNEHFSKLFGVSIPTINRFLSNLKDQSLIRQISFDGRIRRLETTIEIKGRK